MLVQLKDMVISTRSSNPAFSSRPKLLPKYSNPDTYVTFIMKSKGWNLKADGADGAMQLNLIDVYIDILEEIKFWNAVRTSENQKLGAVLCTG